MGNVLEDNFIAVYDDVLSPDLCKGFIDIYNNAEKLGFTYDRQYSGNKKTDIEDTATKIPSYPLEHIDSENVLMFNTIFWDRCYQEYAKKFSILNEIGNHHSFGIKIQKIEPSQGYHMWHCEQGCLNNSRRIIGWLAYLNDIENGGETEFLYQSKRIQAKQGRVVLFPASFTHTHRGNPPLSDTKYIITGWIEF